VRERSRAAPAVIDISETTRFRDERIPGSIHVSRSRLVDCVESFATDSFVLVVSEDGTSADLAASELPAERLEKISILDGGFQAWKSGGFPTETGEPDPNRFFEGEIAFDDVWVTPFQAKDRQQAMHDYLKWEIGLINEVNADPDFRFSLI